MRTLGPCLAALLLPLAVVGCGGSRHLEVARVTVAPWPGGPGPIAASAQPVGAELSISSVASSLPSTFPANPLQSCTIGAVVRVVLTSGRLFTYGPCRRPRVIERLRLALVHAAETRTGVTANPDRPVSASEWKAVLRDWYDGKLDSWHSCAAVAAAIRHLPVDGPTYSTVFDDLHAYERAVC